MNIPIVPAVIPSDETALRTYAEALAFSPEFHLDIVDGVFVPTVSWPVEPSGSPLSIASLLSYYTLEVDLMVHTPLVQAAEWVSAGADMLVFHIETLSLSDFTTFAEYTPVSVGVSMHGATSIETLLEYAAVADYVQLMGIYEIGAQGQPFDPIVLENIARVKNTFPDMPVSVDGSVNMHTIVDIAQAGADRVICGSAIVQQPDPQQAHAALSRLINVL